MIAVIQCAAKKRRDAGFLRTLAGKPVMFVADPASAPVDAELKYARPDDPFNGSTSWRDELIRYNREPNGNPLKLLPAIELYENPAYAKLANRFGLQNVYVLSAGWGLISGGFLTPFYDVTFSPRAELYKKRRRNDEYRDFSMLPDSRDHLVFFGGKDYLPLFNKLSAKYPGHRTVFHNSKVPPSAPGCQLQKFETTTRTNWHYECVAAFVA
ncbi:MAG TPA: hypothetical protein VL286_05905 [Rhizomicrobium sp.]|jgi:hypothetical protein|nr:hypothetical protein [Rhizomicrobium sp.]